jgi:hypothetical protein
MSPRKIVFDQPNKVVWLAETGGAHSRRRDTSPPQDHRCSSPGCTAWASYGLREPGVVALREPCVWWCKDHRPEVVSQ